MIKTVSLKKPHEFRRLYAKGKSAAGPYFVIYTRPTNKKRNQLGITVTTKLGNAVIRNRIRRRIREVYRLSEQKLRTGFDVVVVARKDALDAPFSGMLKEFMRIGAKLGFTDGADARKPDKSAV